MANAITLRNLQKKFSNSVALDDVSLEAASGELTVLLGPSGCGKSTLLRLVAGLDFPTKGEIDLGAQRIDTLPPSARNIAMVFQNYALFPHLSVADNILFGLQVRRVPRSERAAKLEEVASLLSLDALLSRKPSQLSGGQQQRVALGRAIISGRQIVLMDEPLSNLDAKLRAQ
ncbi:MAG TPA: ABC transporter ATP-binding protein, partial [Aliiroseovarius sp.]|nr:ABC transporter ATP-binding protein [Aliiroseovarius sp.]